ncbi:hypothetical protein GOV12_02360 [Candidatus Pacearchaeota archaeon]|nr:hypothetical protein [Candidatus Pacearchaeota archaeon]
MKKKRNKRGWFRKHKTLTIVFIIIFIIILIILFSLLLASLPSINDVNRTKCQDGTYDGRCSKNKPSFCLNETLIKKASVCSCPYDHKVDGESCVKIQRCYDGTVFNECSSKKPDFCDNGILQPDASRCGCGFRKTAFGDRCYYTHSLKAYLDPDLSCDSVQTGTNYIRNSPVYNPYNQPVANVINLLCITKCSAEHYIFISAKCGYQNTVKCLCGEWAGD